MHWLSWPDYSAYGIVSGVICAMGGANLSPWIERG